MAYFSESDRVYALDKIAELGQENAKLRELVADMAREYECGYLKLPQRLADRMRELRVGVDE